MGGDGFVMHVWAIAQPSLDKQHDVSRKAKWLFDASKFTVKMYIEGWVCYHKANSTKIKPFYMLD